MSLISSIDVEKHRCLLFDVVALVNISKEQHKVLITNVKSIIPLNNKKRSLLKGVGEPSPLQKLFIPQNL